MAISGKMPIAVGLIAALGLAGCEDGQGSNPFQRSSSGASADAASGGPTMVERDVEAPEVFQTQELGLWDGRPSLGGIWVAHPDVDTAETVMIRNLANGRFVMGALFGREAFNPGPKLQVSSDAAAELGMLAGAPVELSVVAIRREAVAIEPMAVETPAEDGAIEETSLDPVTAVAATAIDKAEAAAAGAPTTSLTPVARPVAKSAATTAPAAAAPASGAALSRPFVQIGLFGVKANADQTAELLRNSGVIPTVKQFTSNGKTYWRVLVGPVTSAADQRALLAKVAGLGFGDAYAVAK